MEITVKGNKITLKKDYLTNGEVNYIVGEVLKIYNQEGDIDGYSYSPLAMITNFYALLFSICIDGYDIDNIEDHLMMSLSKQIISVENIVDKNLNKLINMVIERIPDAKTMNKMVNKLPKDWQKVVDEHNEIVGKTITKEDE